ncbi:MAG TPA: hypothetical protein V6D29_16750 [Leptolyngbyaceae cyanobacterium]
MENFGVRAQGYDPYVRSLLRLSQESEQKKLGQGAVNQQSREESLKDRATLPTLGFSLNVNYASPLSPLRSRDVQALVEMFAHDQLTEIEADIHQYLHRLYPEPCWEIEPYEFLRGFL